MNKTIFSADRQFRYALWRRFDLMTDKAILFVMLNPSTADESRDDPTIRRCLDFAKRWGYGRLAVGNLFPYRSPDPRRLREWVREAYWGMGERHPPPLVINENRSAIHEMASEAELIVCAWGNHGVLKAEGASMIEWFEEQGFGAKLRHLGHTRVGQPRHPLYVPKATRPQRLRRQA